MGTWKKKIPHKLRKIKLVETTNIDYQDYIQNIKLEHLHFRASNRRAYSDLISSPMEKAIRKWIDLSGLAIPERVVSYELLFNDKYEKRFNEIDCIFKIDERLWLVEIKVSSSPKALSAASNQLQNAQNILKREGINVELLIIHVNLKANTDLQIRDNFSEMLNQFYKAPDSSHYTLVLNPFEVYDLCIAYGINLDKIVLEYAISEAQELQKVRQIVKRLKEYKIPKEEWPDELKNKQQLTDDQDYILIDKSEDSTNQLRVKLRQALALNKKGND